ncbi:MAG TPA: peptidoglycan-binding protein, partial [Pseudonocardiaceae bacterium]|nr:peptidoglycan-binding protein [Pseudonocardiaceae bacterium]
MLVLRRGDADPAVVEIRSTLVALELLPVPDSATRETVFDAVVEQAVRAFQQQRGLLTDGVVGSATFRALRDATYHLGGRPLAYLVSAPITGDDV